MSLASVSIERPVLATVMSLFILIIGFIGFTFLFILRLIFGRVPVSAFRAVWNEIKCHTAQFDPIVRLQGTLSYYRRTVYTYAAVLGFYIEVNVAVVKNNAGVIFGAYIFAGQHHIHTARRTHCIFTGIDRIKTAAAAAGTAHQPPCNRVDVAGAV